MTIELGGTLILLALVDSLSFGTLLIPLLFLMVPGRVRVARIVLYLATIALFYLVAGVAITWGAQSAVARFGVLLDVWRRGRLGAGLLRGALRGAGDLRFFAHCFFP